RLDTLMTYAPADMLDYVKVAALKMFGGAIAIMGLIAAADFLYQRSEFLKKQRMSRQEIKDEHKQTDGDPQVKARIQRIRMERARGRMMAAVPEATLVIANPTHFAVALKYEHQEMNAPVCVAKGVDEVALRIRSVAEENGVPVVENPPLARALHASVELEQEITPEHYQAVAEVIGYVMGLRK
ncbi:MAG TPA: flagellar biosynthesis protein FlhB, partial [Alphaproteobacteria bacterium]|nr:flagellar biosynthesis protein FlhB [Alphaproteobacteria bacterium]HBA41685.1 flagellar biosynthesis protein FlhB [Alphaproteobacteria bacterium]